MTYCTVLVSLRFHGESVANELLEIIGGDDAVVGAGDAQSVPHGYAFDEWICGAHPGPDSDDDMGELLLSFSCGARDELLQTLMVLLRDYVSQPDARGAG